MRRGTSNNNYRHGERCGKRLSHEYSVWKAMRQRCNNPRHPRYKDYGGRGIKVCKRWDNFADFLADVGRAPSPRHSLERVKNNYGYAPANVRWATPAEQNRNSRQNVFFTRDGQTLCLTDWCKKIGVHVSSVYAKARRLEISVEEALFGPWRGEGLAGIARRSGINYQTLVYRVRSGMSLEEAIKKPVRKR